MKITLGELANKLGLVLDGDPECMVSGISTISRSRPDTVTFLADSRYRKSLQDSCASAVILRQSDREYCPVHALISDDPYLSYAHLTALFAPCFEPEQDIHPSSVIHPGARLADNVHIGPHAVIEDEVELADGVVIGAGTVVQHGASIGRNSRLMANVTIYHHCQIGERVLVHSGAVIGSDGFGFAKDRQRWIKIHQIGRVLIGNDVEIGANTCIDRGAIEDTIIEDGVKLDNQIQIAHNVHVGKNTAMAGCVGVAGSAVIGANCAIGGGVGILGHLNIADGTTIASMSLVSHTLHKKGVYASGTTLDILQSWQKNAIRFKQLDEMSRRLRQLEKTLQQLTNKG